jgi:hypothetical protein
MRPRATLQDHRIIKKAQVRGTTDGCATRDLNPRTRGLRVRCSAYPQVHPRSPVQVSAVYVLPWTALDTSELQLELQLEGSARFAGTRGSAPPWQWSP